jgi:hypothetical protein
MHLLDSTRKKRKVTATNRRVRVMCCVGNNVLRPDGLSSSQTATISASYAGQQVTDAVEKDIFHGRVFRK